MILAAFSDRRVSTELSNFRGLACAQAVNCTKCSATDLRFSRIRGRAGLKEFSKLSGVTRLPTKHHSDNACGACSPLILASAPARQKASGSLYGCSLRFTVFAANTDNGERRQICQLCSDSRCVPNSLTHRRSRSLTVDLSTTRLHIHRYGGAVRPAPIADPPARQGPSSDTPRSAQ